MEENGRYRVNCNCIVRRSPHHKKYIEAYLKRRNISDAYRLAQELGDNMSYVSMRNHLTQHVDFSPEWERQQKKLLGYCTSWASENAVMIGILENFGKIFEQFQTAIEEKFKSGDLATDYLKISKDLRSLLKELKQHQEELAKSPLVSIDVIYQVFLSKLGELCPECRQKLLSQFEADLEEIRREGSSFINKKASG
ncbi:MAG: hypothetical protein ACXQTL_04950 [Methanosarcinales archaeon]